MDKVYLNRYSKTNNYGQAEKFTFISNRLMTLIHYKSNKDKWLNTYYAIKDNIYFGSFTAKLISSQGLLLFTKDFNRD